MSYVDKSSVNTDGWKEKETHEQIMDALSKVKGETGSYYYINGYYYYWTINELPAGEPERIAKRGNHEEILYMIHQYGKTKCDVDRRHLCWSSHGNEDGALLSDEVQKIILERNNPVEINAYLTYHGFAPAGQDIILDRGDHAEIMRYLERHGFASKQQVRLWKRGNDEEIKLHIARHGCCNELLDELFKGLKTGEGREDFVEYIRLHELPVVYQIYMLRMADEEIFEVYINKYGLWLDTHADLVKERSVEELIAYIKKHRFLGRDGEWALARRQVTRLTKFYIEHRVNKGDDTLLGFLLKVRPLDYEALSTYFLQMDFSRTYVNQDDYRLISKGTDEEVKQRIEKSQLDDKCLAALFFRNRTNEFEAYVDKWIRR